jgi:aspartate/methionine/tyrosine aminotransferase
MYRPAQRLADISPFHVVELLTRARQLEAEGRDIIHMEVGEPDFPTPAPIANAAVDAIKSGKSPTVPPVHSIWPSLAWLTRGANGC